MVIIYYDWYRALSVILWSHVRSQSQLSIENLWFKIKFDCEFKTNIMLYIYVCRKYNVKDIIIKQRIQI